MFLTALVLATAVQAPNNCALMLVCPKPIVKVAPKKLKPKPAPKPTPKAPECPKCATIIYQNPTEVIFVTETIRVPAPVPEAPKPIVGVGLRVGLGASTCVRSPIPLVGVRIRGGLFGVDISSHFAYGGNIQALLYPVRGDVSWYVGAGVLGFGTRYLSAIDVPRTWDITAGTGIEWKFLKHLSLFADLRTSVPNPVVLSTLAQPDADGRHLNVGNVVGNSLWRSQVFAGIMVHSW